MVDDLRGGRWAPPRSWNPVHGNGKSASGGQFPIETMKDSTGKYVAKIVGTNDGSVVIDDGNSANGPSFAQIISGLKAKYCSGFEGAFRSKLTTSRHSCENEIISHVGKHQNLNTAFFSVSTARTRGLCISYMYKENGTKADI